MTQAPGVISSSVSSILFLPLITSPPLSVDWDSYEAHQAVINAPSYQAIHEALKPSLSSSGKAEMYHVQFSAPTIALEKPVTEVVILTLKAPENRAAVVDILSKASEASEKKFVFGQTCEDENKYVIISGWLTVEVCRRNATRVLRLDYNISSSQEHWETAAKPEVADAMNKLFSLANKDHLSHTKLSQYQL